MLGKLLRTTVIVVCGVIAATIFTGVVVSIAEWLHPLCGEEIIVEKPSPDGRYVAVLMSRNCGATTPYVAHINLRRSDHRFRSGFFSAGTISDGQILITSKYNGERFCWSGPKSLEVGYPVSDDVQVTKKWFDVNIGSDYLNPKCQ